MKVPTRVTPRTQEASTPLAGLSISGADANAFGAPIGQGLQKLGGAIEGYAEAEAHRASQIEDFSTQRRLTDLQSEYFTKTLPGIQRNARPDGQGFTAQADEEFQKWSFAFLETVPPAKRPEYSAKIAQYRAQNNAISTNFERTAGDSFFEVGINDEASKAKAAIATSPEEAARWKQHVLETIDKSALPTLKKEELKRATLEQLSEVQYKATLKTGELNAANMPIQGGVEVFTNNLVRSESANDPSAKNPRSSATGLGQFTERTWLDLLRTNRPDLAAGQPDEFLLAMRLDSKLSREMVARYAENNARILQQSGFAPSPGNLHLAHFLGPEGARKVLSSSDATRIETLVSPKAFKDNKEVFDKAPTVAALKSWAVEQQGGNRPVSTVQAVRGEDGYWRAPGVEYDLSGKVRAEPVSKEYVEKVIPALQAIDPSLGIKITSAGQQPGHGTGSHRHDVDKTGHSNTSDFVLTKNGKPIRPGDDKALYVKAVEELAAAGFTGIGHYEWGIHVGGGSRSAWGPDKTSASVDPDMQRAIQRGWARASDGKRDALDTDLNYAAIPYEKRVALRADAQREAALELNGQMKEREGQRKQQIDMLNVSLYDGKAGAADIDRLRTQGILQSYEEIKKANDILAARTAGISDQQEGLRKLTNDIPFDPQSADDKKRLNAVVGEAGIAEIGKGNKEFFNSQIIPVVERAKDIPTEVAGTLQGMMRSSNPQRMLYALDAMTQLQRADERAFTQRFTDDTRRDVERYQLLRDRLPADQLAAAINGGYTQEERQARKVRRSDAMEMLQKKDGKIPQIEKLVANAAGDFVGFLSSSPNMVRNAAGAGAMQRQFEALWVEEYAIHGDADVATKVVEKSLKEKWGTTELGGKGRTLMELPPEKVYKPLGGGYAWIDKQVREMAKLAPGDNYELISDEQTRQEFAAFGRGADQGPSYRVIRVDANGVPREENFGKNGRPQRYWFKPDEKALAEEVAVSQERSDAAANNAFYREFNMAKQLSIRSGVPVPAEMQEENRQRIKRDAEMYLNRATRARAAMPQDGYSKEILPYTEDDLRNRP